MEAASRFPEFRGPVLIVWGEDDLFSSPRLGGRLQRGFPNARLELVDRSRAFLWEGGPGRLAELIALSLRERADARVHGGVA